MTDDMNSDKFNALKSVTPPEASLAARQRALDLALAAFDAADSAAPKKNAAASQGNIWLQRLRSIVPDLKGKWIMDIRLPIGTLAVALLLLPLGYQLYTSTAITQPAGRTAMVPAPVRVAQKPAEPAPPLPSNAAKIAPPAPMQQSATPEMETAPAAEPAMDSAMSESVVASQPAPVGGIAMNRMASSPSSLAPIDTGDNFAAFSESPIKVTAQEPVSTFSVDVDTASYSYSRSMIEDGYIPEPDAVRVEEMINYFPYGYAAPTSADVPFKPTMAIFPTPWNPKTQLLQIGIKGYVPPADKREPRNLVFLFDTSGSMDEPNKLPLLKRAFALLVDTLTDDDTISIVTYAGSAGVVLEPTKAGDKAKILTALDGLEAGGSTAGGEGIALAYKLAEQSRIANGINRVILATDGDFNVGIDDPDELKDYIRTKRASGVFLSVLGFGRGNLDDAVMQSLAQNGNGNAAYIDSFKEAQKVLVAEGGSTLQTIAKDVKIQVEFNPAVVSEYRLIGYETRALNREDFNNDKVDAGDVGAGHTVTALYEITPVGAGAELVAPLRYGKVAGAEPVTNAGGELGFLKLRYKLPDENSSRLIETAIDESLAVDDTAKASDDARFTAAVAAFGQKLKGSDYVSMSWDAIRTLAQGARGNDLDGYRAEFVQLVDGARMLADK